MRASHPSVTRVRASLEVAAVDAGERGLLGASSPWVERRLTKRDEFTGPEAAELAGVTYRQLAYWARRGWVTPSATTTGADRRRRYRRTEVVRLAALGHPWEVTARCRIVRTGRE